MIDDIFLARDNSFETELVNSRGDKSEQKGVENNDS